MKNLLLCALFILLFSYPASAIDLDNDYVEGEVFVTIQAPPFSYYYYNNMSAYSQALMDQAEAFASRFGLQVKSIYPEMAKNYGVSHILLRSEHKSTQELIMELSSDPDVIKVTPNHIQYFGPIPPGEEEKDNDKKDKKDGGGGCNTGYGSVSFLLAVLMSPAINKIFRKKRVLQ